MIDKVILKQILRSNQDDVEGYKVISRSLPPDGFSRNILVGLRRAGKTFMLFQKMQELLSQGKAWDEMLYLNFEDDRLGNFSMEDFDTVLACHAEMYGKRPMLFLDEIQNIAGWEKFARRLADTKYDVWITGSNAKMFSSEIMTTLGGRYYVTEVYPYSFEEYLGAQHIKHDKLTICSAEARARILMEWEEYLHWGGLPETVGLPVKRNYLSSALQKIYLGDICSRNRISNPNLLRLLLKKISENVGQPVSYNRLSQVLSSVSGKVTMPTVSKYIEHCESAWLLLRLRNVAGSFAEKESVCKYYFIDNGILNLFMIDGETALLENAVALALFRKYGNDSFNDRVYFYRNKVEVDFYIPEDETAIQVSYSIGKSPDTFEREVEALKRFPKAHSCSRRIIITNDEERTISDENGEIEVLPAWKWLLDITLA